MFEAYNTTIYSILNSFQVISLFAARTTTNKNRAFFDRPSLSFLLCACPPACRLSHFFCFFFHYFFFCIFSLSFSLLFSTRLPFRARSIAQARRCAHRLPALCFRLPAAMSRPPCSTTAPRRTTRQPQPRYSTTAQWARALRLRCRHTWRPAAT